MGATGVAALILVAATALIWMALEGSVIVTAARAAGPDGAARLRRMGMWFLGSEAWTLALLGLLHGVLPGPTHEVFGRLPWAPAVFVFGWMARDLGLWLGPRQGGGVGWRRLVAGGAVLQLVGASGVIIGVLLLRPPLVPGRGAGPLLWTAPPVLLAGLGLQMLLRRLTAHGCGTAVPPIR